MLQRYTGCLKDTKQRLSNGICKEATYKAYDVVGTPKTDIVGEICGV
jgi:hypothetical protein